MFYGSMVALVTPLSKDVIDVDCLRQLVEFHIKNGTQAIIAAGTTGEAGTLSHHEKLLVIKSVVEQAKERIPVIAGTAANSTQDCIELTKEAMNYGAHGALIMTPAYIKPTQEGLYQHYRAIAEAVSIPILLYNVPGRTACDLKPETVKRLAAISNIVGIKEATGEMARLKELNQLCGERMDVYSGDDVTASAWLLAGAKGVISVTANVAPQLMSKMCAAALNQDQVTCIELNEQLKMLNEALFVESNPIPIKWAMSKLGLLKNELRLPLTSLSNCYHAHLERILKDLELH